MRFSLIYKLMGAFLLVIAIGALVISILTSQATRNAFNLYTTRSGLVWAQRLAPTLADYYAQSTSWQGVDTVLLNEFGSQMMPGSGMGMGAGQGRGPAAGRPAASAGTAAMGMGQRLILTDARGTVVADTLGEWLGKQLTAEDLLNGAAIVVKNIQVGTLIVTPNEISGSGSLSSDFLTSANQAIVSSAIIAGGIALILGMALFLQITSPLRQLKKATAAIAAGDLSQRVNIRSGDEFGELGYTFNRMAENLDKAETQRRHMVADVAHELRTPLAAIQGTLEGMQDGILPLDEEQLTALYTETMLLNRLVGDLRLLSLAEAGQLQLERQETQPGSLIENLVERAKPQAEQKDIRLVAQLEANLPPTWLDSDRITQVLNNLIGNALHYTPAGGVITVQAGLLAGGTALQIAVSDSGPGIAAEDLPYIFDRFYRADKSRTRGSGGSGLGLAIVKQLVEAHGGTVKAESPVYRDDPQAFYGTKMIFILPILNEEKKNNGKS